MKLVTNSVIFFLSSFLCSGLVMGFEYDPDFGEEINEVCAGCHGEYGEGGKEGEYPRIAGMPAKFLTKQLELFRERIRPNIAMVEFVDHRQMPDEDIYQISTYLERTKLKTRLPPVDDKAPDFDAYARLLESKKLMQIPRAPGDIVRGEKLYKKECAICHGKDGYGNVEKAVPLLAGQYTNYLWRQVKKLREKIRIHDSEAPEEELLDDFSDEELTDMFAWLSIADD
jgi:cytochrome c553